MLFILPLPCSYSGYTDQRIHEGFQALIFFLYFNSFSPLPFDSSLQSFLTILFVFVFVLNISSLILCWSRVSRQEI